MSVEDFNANKKWLKIPQNFRDRITNNVYCSHCKTTVKILQFTLTDDSLGVVLNGACPKCSNKVARFVEDDK